MDKYVGYSTSFITEVVEGQKNVDITFTTISDKAKISGIMVNKYIDPIIAKK